MNTTSPPSALLGSAAELRQQFPILARTVRGRPLVYLDNAATTQKPRCVIDAVSHYYEYYNANVHRAAHALADEATSALEAARVTVAEFMGAASPNQVVFSRGTTESINLVANGIAPLLKPGDELILSRLEHHSNIVPWQMLCERTGAVLKIVEVTPDGDLDLESYRSLLSERTRLVAIGHVSNALGTVNPIALMIAEAHAVGAWFLVDGAQATAHLKLDMQALDCDFYAFSGHKCFGPTGIGVLYGRMECLEQLQPWQGGGEMIERVSFSGTSYNRVPYRFEAGTPPIAAAIGLGEALRFIAALPLADLVAAEHKLVQWTVAQLRQMPGLKLVGDPAERQSVVSFVTDSGQPDDVGTLLDQQGVAVRTGHHCAMPLMEHWGLPGTVRASFGLYNTEADAEAFVTALRKVLTFL